MRILEEKEEKSTVAGRSVLVEVENHEKVIRNLLNEWKSSFWKLRDLLIRRNIIRGHTAGDDLFPVTINSHIRQSLSWEIAKKINQLEDITENYTKSLNRVESASEDIGKELRSIPSGDDRVRLLSSILDASLVIVAHGTSFQIALEQSLATLQCENANSVAIEGVFAGNETRELSELLGFINEFLIRCHGEQLLWQKKDST